VAIHRVMNRGPRREPIFREKEDSKLFLGTLVERCGMMRSWKNMSKLLSWQRRKRKCVDEKQFVSLFRTDHFLTPFRALMGDPFSPFRN